LSRFITRSFLDQRVNVDVVVESFLSTTAR